MLSLAEAHLLKIIYLLVATLRALIIFLSLNFFSLRAFIIRSSENSNYKNIERLSTFFEFVISFQVYQ